MRAVLGELVWKEDEQPAANVHDAWITQRFGTGWGENPVMLGVAEQDPNLCYGTDFGRTMQTTDGGKTWNAVYSRKIPGGEWTSTGLDVTTNYGIHFDPFNRKRQFIDYTDIGLFPQRRWRAVVDQFHARRPTKMGKHNILDRI